MNGKWTIGIDTAKRVFFLHGENELGKVILREKVSRERLLPFLANQPVSTIAIEAGCGAHHWARELQAVLSRYGVDMRLGAALQIGFLKMCGRPLDKLQRVPGLFSSICASRSEDRHLTSPHCARSTPMHHAFCIDTNKALSTYWVLFDSRRRLTRLVF